MGEDATSRSRGILTERDRQFLQGELNNELTDNAKYQKRHQIRKRIRNSMYDFGIIYRYLSNRDVNQIWAETDNWISVSAAQEEVGDAPPYPEKPYLAKCWRDMFAFFVWSQISTGTAAAARLVEWAIEEGVNKAVRRYYFGSVRAYQQVDASIDWGLGARYHIEPYLRSIGQDLPGEPEEAEEYLLTLLDQGHIQHNHAVFLYQTYAEESD